MRIPAFVAMSALSLCVTALSGLALPAPSAAAAQTSGWASWTPITGTSNDYATTMQLPAGGFPSASVASDSRGNVALPSGASTFLGPSTPPGAVYGSSRNQPYLNLRPKADNASSPSTTTYTFASPTPAAGWTFVLGDIDADKVQVSAKDAAGQELTAAQIDPWFRGSFNYAGDADMPTWDPATATLTGNPAAADTNGAAGWFEPTASLSTLTFTFTQRSGFPVYQTWFASLARSITGTITDASTSGSCDLDAATLELVAPDGSTLATTHPTDGNYDFGQFATQAGYTVRLTRPPGCAVVGPEERSVDTTTSDATADFVVRRDLPQPVSGRVTEPDGTPVAGVEITLTPPSGPTKVTTTDEEGRYRFDDNAELPGYTVAVTAEPDGFVIRGASSHSFDIEPGTPVTGADFTLVELPAVSGTVTGGGGALAGVTVALHRNRRRHSGDHRDRRRRSLHVRPRPCR